MLRALGDDSCICLSALNYWKTILTTPSDVPPARSTTASSLYRAAQTQYTRTHYRKGFRRFLHSFRDKHGIRFDTLAVPVAIRQELVSVAAAYSAFRQFCDNLPDDYSYSGGEYSQVVFSQRPSIDSIFVDDRTLSNTCRVENVYIPPKWWQITQKLGFCAVNGNLVLDIARQKLDPPSGCYSLILLRAEKDGREFNPWIAIAGPHSLQFVRRVYKYMELYP